MKDRKVRCPIHELPYNKVKIGGVKLIASFINKTRRRHRLFRQKSWSYVPRPNC